MPDTHEPGASPRRLRIPALGFLWCALAAAYLAASATGHRDFALGVVGLMAGTLVAASSGVLAGLATSLLTTAACLYWSDSISSAVHAPPLAAFAFMAFFFHRTLRPGEIPLITRVARMEHPDLPMAMVRYTRMLTWIWSMCFALMFVAALLWAPILALDAWSRRVHGMGYLVPTLLFLGEYAYRHHRFRDHAHDSIPALIANILSVVRDAAIKPGIPATKVREPR
jgi:uncharacterized membrane protein